MQQRHSAQAKWDQCIAEFADKPYDWPSAYCCALAHRLLDNKTSYPLREKLAGSELRMLTTGLRDFGTIGGGHSTILRVAGATLIQPHLIEAHSGIRISWATAGIIGTERGAVMVDGDTRGVMVFHSPTVDRLIWCKEGLTQVFTTLNTTITRAWKL